MISKFVYGSIKMVLTLLAEPVRRLKHIIILIIFFNKHLSDVLNFTILVLDTPLDKRALQGFSNGSLDNYGFLPC